MPSGLTEASDEETTLAAAGLQVCPQHECRLQAGHVAAIALAACNAMFTGSGSTRPEGLEAFVPKDCDWYSIAEGEIPVALLELPQ